LKVDQRALDAIEVKIARAKQHLAFLHDQMASWQALAGTKTQPWGLVPEVHDQGRKHFFRLRFAIPFPPDWAVVLGEALHDLRSALDQCVYWLTVDNLGREVKGTAFPVKRERNAFYAKYPNGRNRGKYQPFSGMVKVEGVGPGPLAFIEWLQPYRHRRHFAQREIRMLDRLWNQDKHRLVHLWGLRFDFGELGLPAEMVLTGAEIGVDRRVLHEGAIPVRVTCRVPRDEVKVVGAINANVAFNAGRGDGSSRNLWDLATTVEDVIRKLLLAIGDQDRPINREVWSVRDGAKARFRA
jgi:hypothetical protein